MSSIIFMPDDHTLISLESPLPSGEILQAVNQGKWTPPEPYSCCMPAGNGELHALRQGRRVLIIAKSPMNPSVEVETPLQTRKLSPRQAEVLQGLFKGLTTKEIAYQLGLKPRTVKMHVAALKHRFGANTRAQSVGIAAKLGLLEKEQDLES